MKLKTLEQVVFETLTEQPETQKDDFILILKVYEKLTDKDTMGQSFSVLMTYHNDFGLPPFESVRRCRQKVQAKHPELVDPSTAKHRHKLIEDYKDYAKDKEVVRTHKVGDKAIVIGNDGPILHFFDIGSTVSFTGFNERGHYNFVNKTGLTQELKPNHFKWLSNEPKPKQAKLIRDNGYFFKVGEIINLVDKNDLMGLFTNGTNTGWVYLTDIKFMITFNELLERAKSERIAVHTPTEEQAIALLRELDKSDYVWLNKEKMTTKTYFEDFKQNTCYSFGMSNYSNFVRYGSLGFYQEWGYTIIEFSDIDFEEE